MSIPRFQRAQWHRCDHRATTMYMKARNILNSAPSSLFVFVIALHLNGCRTASAPSHPMDVVTNAPRSVNGSWITFTAMGEDRFADRAQFLAENAALADVANECSFIPKSTVHQVYEAPVANPNLPRSFEGRQFTGKAFVDRVVCDEAKHAILPERIAQLANTDLMNRLRTYQDTIGEVAKASAERLARLNKEGIENEAGLLAVRQQILYVKQALLAETLQPTKTPGSLEEAIAQADEFARKNPAVQTSKLSWSASQKREYGSISEPVLSPDLAPRSSRSRAEKNSKRPTHSLPPKAYPKPR